MANLNYYLGPLIWNDVQPMRGWRAPDGVVGMVDLGSIPDCSLSSGDSRPLAFLCSTATLGAGWDLLGTGDCREIATTAAMRSAWKSLTGYQPQGDKLIDLLADHIMNGADPQGLDACPPLVPTRDLSLEIHLCGHSRVWSEVFAWGKHKHTNKLKQLLKRDAKAIKDAIKTQKDQEHYEKVLGAWERKYGPGVAKEIDATTNPRKPSTSVSENFDGTDSTTLGKQQTWTELGGFSNTGNRARVSTYNDSSFSARCEADVSSADHYVQSKGWVTGKEAAYYIWTGSCARHSSSAFTCYATIAGYGNGVDQCYPALKYIAGVVTVLSGPESQTFNAGQITKCAVSGSSITGTVDGSQKSPVTDTAISGNTRGGIYGYAPVAGRESEADDFLIDDGISGHPTRKRFGGVQFSATGQRGVW